MDSLDDYGWKELRRGDVMQCIRATGCAALTLGELYKVAAYDAYNNIRIRNDDGNLRYYPARRFQFWSKVARGQKGDRLYSTRMNGREIRRRP